MTRIILTTKAALEAAVAELEEDIGDGVGSGTLPDPTAPGQVAVSESDGTWAGALRDAAAPYTAVPNPDTEDGSPDESNTFAIGGHSHARSGLYDGFGADVLHIVLDAGGELALPDVTTNQMTAATLTENCIIAMPTPVAGGRCKLALSQDGTGGWEPFFGTNVAWAAATAPTWSTGPGDIDLIEFVCIDGANWIGYPLALGVVRPAAAMSVIQTVQVPSFFTATFENPVTPGNAVLLVRATVADPPSDAPSGGGCSNWTQIGTGFVRPGTTKNMEVWLGTNSTGGAGSESLSSVEQSYWAKFYEIQGVAPDQGEASSAAVYNPVTNVALTDVGGLDYYDTGELVADGTGQMPFFMIEGMGTSFGPGDANLQAQVPGAPWVTEHDIVDYQGSPTGVIIAYQLNTTDEASYQPRVTRRNDGGNAYSANSIGFLLKPPI